MPTIADDVDDASIRERVSVTLNGSGDNHLVTPDNLIFDS